MSRPAAEFLRGGLMSHPIPCRLDELSLYQGLAGQPQAAETGGALAGLRVVAITSGRGDSSRGAAVLVSCLG